MRIHVPLWGPWLQCTPICAHRHRMSCPWKAKKTIFPRSTLQMSVCPWHIARTLSVMECLDGGNEVTAGVRNSLFQTQIYQKPISHVSRHHRCGARQCHDGIARKNANTAPWILPPSHPTPAEITWSGEGHTGRQEHEGHNSQNTTNRLPSMTIAAPTNMHYLQRADCHL